jgi:NAD(P)-dependent dehydrogenase (short-subunit alcohol dehydrogenase family)
VQLRGRTALVTGGASGIGFGMAGAFAASGMTVAIADIDPERVRSATARLRERSPNVVGFEVDVADPDSVIGLRDQARRGLRLPRRTDGADLSQ